MHDLVKPCGVRINVVIKLGVLISVSLQVMRHDSSSILELDGKEVSEFTPSKPREKWLRKRTHVKIRVSFTPSVLVCSRKCCLQCF